VSSCAGGDDSSGRTGYLVTPAGDPRLETAVAFSPKGGQLASASWDHTVLVWDSERGKVSKTLSEHTDRVNCIAWRSDGYGLVSAGDDRTIRLWDVRLGTELRQFVGHTESIVSLSFRPDGNVIASSSLDRMAKLWSTIR